MDPSLSVFQFFLWTIVLMFVLSTVYLIRAFGGLTEAIPVYPLYLLALTGISIVTPLGSSLISSLGYPKADTVVTVTSEDRPPWGEMLREFGKPSLSRFQMFGWTWISIVIYLAVYGAEISNHYSNVGILSLNTPDVYPVLVALMGLSQVMFLGAKANVTNQIEITKVFPLQVARRGQLSIFGLNFGSDRQDVWLGTHRIGSTDKDLLGWSDGRIDIMIPDIPDPLREDGYEIMIAKDGSSKIAFRGGSPIRIKIGHVVIETNPKDGETSISTTLKKVSATFSEKVDRSTISATASVNMPNASFKLSEINTKRPISGEAVLNPDGVTAEFNLTESLSPASEYQATITKDVKDLAGHSMPEDKSWSFKTE